MLWPFLGKGEEDPTDPNTGRFDAYCESGPRHFHLAPLDGAAAGVLPFDWTYTLEDGFARDAAEQFAEKVARAGLRTIVFFVNDSAEEVRLPSATVFRTSLHRSTQRANEFAQPAWSEDFVTRYLGGALPIRQKARKPTVGFCGMAAPGLPRIPSLRPRGEISLRAQVLREVRRTRGVKTNFLIRKGFVGGAVDGKAVNTAALRKVRAEYVRTTVESDYVVCARGGGNFSYRLYETLSCGRIPVFIDTDCVLPYERMIDWSGITVWTDQADLTTVGERIREFHSALGPREFVELQHECRRVWEEYIRPEGFFSHLRSCADVPDEARSVRA